jgi:hypothetical protein
MIEETLTFRIIKFGLEHETFTIRELQKKLELDDPVIDFIRSNLVATNFNAINSNSLFATRDNIPEHYRTNKASVDTYECRLLPNAIFSYIDHEEIVVARKATIEARKASEESIKLSQDSIELSKKSIKVAWAAIWISVVVGVVSVILQAMEVFK